MMEEEAKKTRGHKMGHHKDRDDIIGEHKLSDMGQLVFLGIFTVLWVLDSFVFNFSTLLTEYIPIYVVAPIGGVILILAGYLAFKGLRQVFKEVRDPPEVIRTGVFRYSRHPVYLGSILLYLGLTIITLSLASLGLLVGIVIFYNFIASYEEQLLSEQFEDEYEDYKEDTPRWIPVPKIGKSR